MIIDHPGRMVNEIILVFLHFVDFVYTLFVYILCALHKNTKMCDMSMYRKELYSSDSLVTKCFTRLVHRIIYINC